MTNNLLLRFFSCFVILFITTLNLQSCLAASFRNLPEFVGDENADGPVWVSVNLNTSAYQRGSNPTYCDLCRETCDSAQCCRGTYCRDKDCRLKIMCSPVRRPRPG
jgi:hypothetical protein